MRVPGDEVNGQRHDASAAVQKLLVRGAIHTRPGLQAHTVGVNAVCDVDAFVALEHDGAVEGPFLIGVAVAVVTFLIIMEGKLRTTGEGEK